MLKVLIFVLGIVCVANADTMRDMACSKGEPLTFCIQNYKVQCDGANYAACVLVGDLQREQKKFNEAKKFYEIACDTGKIDGESKVNRNDGMKLEVQNAVQTSCRLLGYLYKEGKGVRKDANKSLLYYKKSCDFGDMGGCYGIGHIYLKGDKGVKQDLNLARQFFLGSCNKGYGYSCFLLAKMYANGDGIKQNLQSAKEFYGRACDFGEQDGCDKYVEIDSAIEAQKQDSKKYKTKKSTQKSSQNGKLKNNMSVNLPEKQDENIQENKDANLSENLEANLLENKDANLTENSSAESQDTPQNDEAKGDESSESKDVESNKSKVAESNELTKSSESKDDESKQ